MTDNVTRRTQTRRWFRACTQFSLRSLLIAITMLCVGLGIFYHYVEPHRTNRAAAKAIVENGGRCETMPVGPDFLRSVFGPEFLQGIVAVEMPPEATLACADLLPRLRFVERITADGSAFTDKHLAAVGRLPKLRELTLRGTTVSADCLRQLEGERPGLKVTAEPLDISFANDLRFAERKGQPFDRSQLTQRILGLDGSPVRIKGYMLPSFRQFGHRQFGFVRDNKQA